MSSPSSSLRSAISRRSAAWAGLTAHFSDAELDAFASGAIVPTREQDKLIVVVTGGSLGGWSSESGTEA